MKMQQDRCRWQNYNLKYKRNYVFSSKQTKNKVPPSIFTGFKVRRKVWLMFWGPKDSMKAKSCVFSGYKEGNKVCLGI